VFLQDELSPSVIHSCAALVGPEEEKERERKREGGIGLTNTSRIQQMKYCFAFRQ